MKRIRSVVAVGATMVAMLAFFSLPAIADSNNGPVGVQGLKSGHSGYGDYSNTDSSSSSNVSVGVQGLKNGYNGYGDG